MRFTSTKPPEITRPISSRSTRLQPAVPIKTQEIFQLLSEAAFYPLHGDTLMVAIEILWFITVRCPLTAGLSRSRLRVDWA